MVIRRVFSAGILLLSSQVFACDDPVDFVEQSVSDMREVLQKSCRVGASQLDVREQIEKIFIPNVDVELITKQVLGRQHWHSSKEGERVRLAEMMKKLLAMQYAEAFSCEYLDNEMTFHPLRGQVKRYSRVESTVSLGEKESLFLRYAVRCDESAWKIYDIVIDGLSLAQTYRSQFNRILQQGGASALTDYLEKQLSKEQNDS